MMHSLLVISAIVYLLFMAFAEENVWFSHSHEHAMAAHAHGLFPVASEDIDELVLMSNGIVLHFSKHDGDWLLSERTTAALTTRRISEFTKMLTTAEPVRTFQPEDLVTLGERDYGFLESRARVKASDSQGHEINLMFGNATPDGGLRYVRKQGDPALYVMSGFLFDQFEQLTAAQSLN